MACDCGLVAARHDGESLNIGRRTRSIPPAIRRALMLRDRGCAFPGCTHTRFLHAHHIKHWLHGGETSVENLALLCTLHHRLVHEGGWRVIPAEDGAFRFRPPAGRWLKMVPPRARVGEALAWVHGWAEQNGLDLGPEVNRPQGDGSKPNYEMAVSAVLAAG